MAHKVYFNNDSSTNVTFGGGIPRTSRNSYEKRESQTSMRYGKRIRDDKTGKMKDPNEMQIKEYVEVRKSHQG